MIDYSEVYGIWNSVPADVRDLLAAFTKLLIDKGTVTKEEMLSTIKEAHQFAVDFEKKNNKQG